MSSIGGANIVTNGLVFALDAANAKSYISGSTIWNDLSGNRNSGSLVNGPTFSSANMGGIIFDGSNDYVLVNSGSSAINPTTAITFGSFFNVTSYSGNYAPIIFKQNNYGGIFEQYILAYVAPWIYIVITGVDRVQKIVSGSLELNKNNYVVGTCDTTTDELKLYTNGNLIQTIPFTSTFDIATDTPLNIGGSGVLKFGTTYTGFTNGKIYNAQIYNRALSASEVIQNYEALKSRYIY